MFGIGNDEANDIFGNMAFSNAPDKHIFEEAADIGSIADFALKQTRSQAMACVLGWIEGGDYSFSAMDDAVAVIADLDGDDEISPDEEAYYNDLFDEVANALVALGADADNVQLFIDDEDDDAGTKLGAFLSAKMQDAPDDDETMIANYAVSDAPIMESMVKVVRAGKIVLKKKRLKRHVKLSAAQRAGLKKARRKAFTGAAKLARKKSMKIRRKRGL